MIECQFISLEDEPPDLVVSLSCAREVCDQEHDIIIQRAPRFEPLLPPEECGATLSVGYDDNRRGLLEWVRVKGDVIEFKAGPVHEERDCNRVDRAEWRDALKLLRRTRQGNAFRLEGA